MSRWLFIGLAIATTLGTLALWSCSQEDGERCQRNDDCASNYCCKTTIGAEPTDSGICVANEAACRALGGTDGGTDTTRDDAGTEVREDGAEAEAEASSETSDGEEALDEADAPEADETPEVGEDVPEGGDEAPPPDA
ncbi:MAG: hypothetical protein HY907_14735 [Deltaproteobacteria bacterium]|nr:hypothetical protein [Deltaproteobacteria bacterium]